MTRRDAGSEARRAAARRMGANWTELHRQEDEAARSSPLHHYIFDYIPGVTLPSPVWVPGISCVARQ